MKGKGSSWTSYVAKRNFAVARKEVSLPNVSTLWKAKCSPSIGANAGHSVKVGDTNYDFHILPSGLVSPTCINIIGSGVVVHVPTFFKEIENIKKKGLNPDGRIFVSDRAHIVFDLHQAVDGLEEVELGQASIGTTKKGIGPTYATKKTRSGVRMGDVFDHEKLAKDLRRMEAGFRKRYGDLLKYNVEEEIERFKGYAEKLQDVVIDEVATLREPKNFASILVEGGQALLLDIDYGTYPFVTSSNTGLGGVLTGLSLGWKSISEVVGVVKAYTTRVGSGPFPTEQLNEDGEKLGSVGREFGVTTGRKRRCGWLDLVVVRHSHEINDYTSINLTKLDVLDDFEQIKLATSYKLRGNEIDYFPANLLDLGEVEVQYETMPGWQTSTTKTRKYEDLPENARKYIERIEKFVGVPIKYIGTGPDRADMITR